MQVYEFTIGFPPYCNLKLVYYIYSFFYQQLNLTFEKKPTLFVQQNIIKESKLPKSSG
jgi:hypothetical protein